MEKTFKEVAHLYLGCKVVIVDGIRDNDKDTLTYMNILGDCGGNQYEWLISNCRPILHRLEDMTEEDAKLIVDEMPMYLGHDKDIDHHFIQALINGTKYVMNYLDTVEITKILLSKHYDLFNLIDNGQAIDAKIL